MKAINIYLVIFLLPLIGASQSLRDTTHLNTFLFEGFPEGKVLMKSGAVETAPLNYNSFDQSIVFRQGKEILSLSNLIAVDTVYIENRRFIPVENLFYEVTAGQFKAALCVSYTSRTRPVVATADHNGSNRQAGNAVSNTISNVYVSRSVYNGAYQVEFIKHFWVKIYNDLYKSNTEKQFLKAVPSYMEKDARDYVKQHNVNFENEEDLKSLIDFCTKVPKP